MLCCADQATQIPLGPESPFHPSRSVSFGDSSQTDMRSQRPVYMGLASSCRATTEATGRSGWVIPSSRSSGQRHGRSSPRWTCSSSGYVAARTANSFVVVKSNRFQASDFLYIIPTIQHLRNVKLTMSYCELPENETQCTSWTPRQKWKRDPEANGFNKFAPRNKHYLNGELVPDDKPRARETSTSPFPRNRVPRRGFVAVSRDDPAYARLCKEQGLRELVVDAASPLVTNGVHSSRTSTSSHVVTAPINGLGSPTLITTAATNGTGNHQPISPSSEAGPAQARPLVNGFHSMLHSSTD